MLACWLASLLYKSAAPPQPRERESVVAGPTININNCERKGPHRATFHPPRHDTWSGRNIYLGGGVFPLTAVNRTSPIARVSINGNRSLRRRKLEVETDDYYYETFVGTLRHLAAWDGSGSQGSIPEWISLNPYDPIWSDGWKSWRLETLTRGPWIPCGGHAQAYRIRHRPKISSSIYCRPSFPFHTMDIYIF